MTRFNPHFMTPRHCAFRNNEAAWADTVGAHIHDTGNAQWSVSILTVGNPSLIVEAFRNASLTACLLLSGDASRADMLSKLISADYETPVRVSHCSALGRGNGAIPSPGTVWGLGLQAVAVFNAEHVPVADVDFMRQTYACPVFNIRGDGSGPGPRHHPLFRQASRLTVRNGTVNVTAPQAFPKAHTPTGVWLG